jgi:hypothetical protein
MMTEARLREILTELQTSTPHGVLAAGEAATDRTFYMWWGPRTNALAAAARLNYGINVELDSDEEDLTDPLPESDEDLPQPPEPPNQTGMYL